MRFNSVMALDFGGTFDCEARSNEGRPMSPVNGDAPTSGIMIAPTRLFSLERRYRIGVPLGLPAIVDRALDDAVLYANDMNDSRQLSEMNQRRQERGVLIEDGFRALAKDFIARVEEKERWDYWMERVK